MAPPTPTIALEELSSRVNTLANGKRRKPAVTLSDCALKELVQYKCNLKFPEREFNGKDPPVVVCKPVVRLLRQCAHGLTVETTAWEGWSARQQDDGKNT